MSEQKREWRDDGDLRVKVRRLEAIVAALTKERDYLAGLVRRHHGMRPLQSGQPPAQATGEATA